MSNLSRRDFLAMAAALPLQRRTADPWDEVPAILARIKPPSFPKRDFDLKRFGSVNEAIVACSAAGGGRVIVPSGTFMTGAIRLKSRVELHLSEGAVLKFSTDPLKYLPAVFTRWEGTELMNYSPFIYAFNEQDVAITGTGTLDGQADAAHWWDWTRSAAAPRRRLMDFGAQGVPLAERVFGEGSNLRPNFIQPYRCRNVFIEGVTIGSEISGGARNIFAEKCRMDSPRLDRALRIKSNSVRGGIIERVFMRDVVVGQVADAVVSVDFFYEEGDAGKYPPVVRDIEVHNVSSRKSTYGLLLRGYPHDPITGVRLKDCVFENVAKPDVLENVKDIVLANVTINGKLLNQTITR